VDDLPVEMDNNNGYAWDLAFSKESNYLIVSCNDGEVRIWPTDPKILADQICPKLGRNMTEESGLFMWATMSLISKRAVIYPKSNLMDRILLFILFASISFPLLSQSKDCEQTLTTANAELRQVDFMDYPRCLSHVLTMVFLVNKK